MRSAQMEKAATAASPVKTAMLDGALLILLAAVLIWPLFRVEFLDDWMSIDGAFISDARFLREHLFSPGWVPLFYCGNRLDYLYPPATRYGTALISRYGGVSAEQAYHIFSAVLYCLSAAGVYAFVRAVSRSRVAAASAALLSVTLSPVMLIFKSIREDSALHMPQHLNVIVRWGEVPHMSAMGILLFALAAAWLALREHRPGMLAAAALFSAFTVSNNFYGAIALAILFSLMVWTLWVAYGGAAVWWRAAAIAGLSYALTACWLTPSYLALTAANLKIVAHPSNTGSRLGAIVFFALFAAISFRLGRRRPERAYSIFLFGALVLFGVGSVTAYYLNFHFFGEFARFVPEFDLLLILAAVECLRRGPLALRICGGLLLAVSFLVALPYLRDPWGVYVRDDHPEKRIEYRLSEWLSRNLPGARVHSAGSVGVWSNVWHDVPQVGGVSEQGMQNQLIAVANWQIEVGNNPVRDIYWLQALGADAIVVHGKRSQEIYHSIQADQKFNGRLAVLFDSGEDDIVYRVPRRFPGLARVVERRRMEALPEIAWNDNNEPQLRAYADAIEHGPDSPASSQWGSWRGLRIRARLREGESVAVQVTFDPAWRASSGGRRLPVRKDIMGFMRIDPPPGEHDIRLEFRLPLENRIGRIVTVLALIVVMILLTPGLRSRFQHLRVSMST